MPAFILVPIAILYGLAMTPTVSSRISIAVKEVNNYVLEKPGSTESSIGQRFEMWRIGFEIFTEHPISGVGISHLNKYYKEYAKRGESPQLAIRDHAHNEYMNTLISRGLIGFTGLMILLIGSGYFFYQHLFRSPTIALAGLTLIAGYATFGLTDSVFFFKFSWVFFFSCLYLLSDAISPEQTV